MGGGKNNEKRRRDQKWYHHGKRSGNDYKLESIPVRHLGNHPWTFQLAVCTLLSDHTQLKEVFTCLEP